MDFFLIKDGTVQNIVVVESLEKAQVLFPDMTIIERTEANATTQIGDAA